MYDVVALGELLIDFIQNGSGENGNPIFEANPGGAPCNVLAMLAKLGYQTAFIGKVGEDYFGRMLGEAVRETGISEEGLIYDKKVNTTLALVHTLTDGDRDFSFYRKPGADIMLEEQEVSKKILEDCRIFHFGSVSLTNEPSASATKAAVCHAKKCGKIISFDPNLREPLWDDMEQAKAAIWYGIEACDIIKIADNEIKWLTGKEDFDEAVQEIRKRADVKMVNVTLGKDGSISYYGDKKVFGKPFMTESTVDTTGAGDTFCASVLGFVLERGLEGLKKEDLERMLLFANAAASIVTTRKGALRSMPQKKEIEILVSEYSRAKMEPISILFRSIAQVKEFVDDMTHIEGDVFLSSGRYVIDAKSIMGIFSLDLAKPLRIEFSEWKEEYLEVISKYLRKDDA